jgi:hypothetical protein
VDREEHLLQQIVTVERVDAELREDDPPDVDGLCGDVDPPAREGSRRWGRGLLGGPHPLEKHQLIKMAARESDSVE